MAQLRRRLGDNGTDSGGHFGAGCKLSLHRRGSRNADIAAGVADVVNDDLQVGAAAVHTIGSSRDRNSCSLPHLLYQSPLFHASNRVDDPFYY